MFSLQVLGAVAQLERALIAERTKAGLRAARSRGRVGGNPGLRARDPDAIRKVTASRDAAYLDAVLARLDSWLPTVRHMRSSQPWGDVMRVLNRGQAGGTPDQLRGGPWTVERLRRTVRRLADEGIVEASLLDRARPQRSDDRLVRLVAGVKAAAPDRTLQQIAAQLESMRERTPRGGTRWHPSSVRHLFARAERLGLSRDSRLGQRTVGHAFTVEVIDGGVDGLVEGCGVGEGLMSEVMRLEVVPDHFDVVEFGGIFWQPLDSEPMCARGQCREREFASVDWPVVLDQHDRLDRPAGFRTIQVIECSRWAMKSLLRLVGLVWTMSWRLT